MRFIISDILSDNNFWFWIARVSLNIYIIIVCMCVWSKKKVLVVKKSMN